MYQNGIIANSGMVLREGVRTPDKFGARRGFFCPTTGVQSTGNSGDNGTTLLGNLENNYITINGNIHLIKQMSESLLIESFVILTNDITGTARTIVETDLVSLTTKNGTRAIASDAVSFQTNSNTSTWTLSPTLVDGSPTNDFLITLTGANNNSTFNFLKVVT